MKVLRFFARLLIGLAFIAIALFCTLVAYVSYQKVADMKSWHPVEATVVTSAIDRQVTPKGTTYCPVIEVTYDFQGKNRTSQLEIKDGPCSPVRTSVASTLDGYDVGARVEAYVNPAEPDRIRAATFSLGLIFYLMVFCAILTFTAGVLAWIAPNKMLSNKGAGGDSR